MARSVSLWLAMARAGSLRLIPARSGSYWLVLAHSGAPLLVFARSGSLWLAREIGKNVTLLMSEIFKYLFISPNGRTE